MFKKVLLTVVMTSLIAFNSCFAFDFNSVKDQALPKISEWWNISLTWVNEKAVPWIGNNLGQKTKDEFQRELSGMIGEVPGVVTGLIDAVKGFFNKK